MTVPRALEDVQLVNFLDEGYVILEPQSLGDADHCLLYERAGELYDIARATASPTAHLDHLGDNLLAMIPELDRLLADPVIDGALQSVLGPDYLTHPHSYCHRSGPSDQVFHQDGNLPWNERGHYRSHRPDWAMLFYYPQEVDATNGPTVVVPGTQYWTVDHETGDGRWHPGDRIDRSVDPAIMGADDLDRRDRAQREGLERGLGIPDLDGRALHVPAGSVVLAHYDLVHRGSRVTDRPDPRYLYKFYFVRVREPRPVSGAGRVPRRRPLPDLGAVRDELRPVVEANWSWCVGGGEPASQPDTEPGGYINDGLDELAQQLLGGREDKRVAAAYRLGALARGRAPQAGDPTRREASGADRPRAGRHTDDEPAPRALAALESGLFSETESTRRAAGHGLRRAGEAGIELLIRALGSDSAPIRRPAVAALGTVTAADDGRAVTALLDLLATDPDDLIRSNAAYSLGQIARSQHADAAAIANGLLARLAPGAEADNAFGAGFSRSTVRQSAALALVQVLTNHDLADELIDRIIDGPLRDDDRYVQGLITEGLARAERLRDDARKRLVRQLARRRWNTTPRAKDKAQD